MTPSDAREVAAAIHSAGASAGGLRADSAGSADGAGLPDVAAKPPGGTLGARIARFLNPAPAERRFGAIFKWWEKRRLGYNAIVGAGAVLSMAGHALMNGLMGWPVLGQMAAVLPIMVAANLGYTLGPLTEAALHKLWGREVVPLGPSLLRAGVALSVGLTFLLPALALGVRVVVRVISAVFGIG